MIQVRKYTPGARLDEIGTNIIFHLLSFTDTQVKHNFYNCSIELFMYSLMAYV